MTRGLVSVAIGLVVFIMVQELVDSLVTGTDAGSTIITNILALAVKRLWRPMGVIPYGKLGEVGGL